MVVTSASKESDSTKNEYNTCSSRSNATYYCGNDAIAANFTVLDPSNPQYWVPYDVDGCNLPQGCNLGGGTVYPPEDVSGTWFYSDGAQDFTLVLSQGAQNSSGDSPISGTETDALCNSGQPMSFGGTLDQLGDFTIFLPCGSHCVEWKILQSGDATSQGLSSSASSCDAPLVPNATFLDGAMDEAEGVSYLSAVPPLFKSQTDLPASETPTPASPGWQILPNSGSAAATYSAWQRTLVAFPDGPASFAGRFVYEQQGGIGADGCYVTGSVSHPYTNVSGGGWYVDQSSQWGIDFVGIGSKGVTWYQDNVAMPCQMTIPQQMNIDGSASSWTYNTNQLIYEIESGEVLAEIQTQTGSVAQECEYYSKGKVSNRSCKP